MAETKEKQYQGKNYKTDTGRNVFLFRPTNTSPLCVAYTEGSFHTGNKLLIITDFADSQIPTDEKNKVILEEIKRRWLRRYDLLNGSVIDKTTAGILDHILKNEGAKWESE